MAEAGLEDEVDVIVGTLGKALGSYGAYVCCEKQMAKYLINTARTLIFSTALSPPPSRPRWRRSSCCASSRGAWEKLQANASVLRRRGARASGPGHGHADRPDHRRRRQ